MDSPPLDNQYRFGIGYQPVNYRKLYCSSTSVSCHRIIPLVDAFSPLATTFEAPILAGETLYPSIEHHVAAQLLRDVQRLDAVQHVPLQLSRSQLRLYLSRSLISVPLEQVETWRKNRMYSALRAATELKFVQYPELRALLLQTGDAFLFEVLDKNDSSDLDWSIGMNLDALVSWMCDDHISPLSLAFFTMHPACKPGVIGSNMTGRLLMELRSQMLDIKSEMDDNDILFCPMCKNTTYPDISYSKTVSNEIVILAGHANPLTFEYPSTFVIGGRCYFSVEHFVKAKLLEEYGYGDLMDNWLADLELRKPAFFKKMADFLWERQQSDDAAEIKNRHPPSIASLRRWSRSRGVEYYEAGLKAKFSQNPHFLRALLATGESLLVELRAGSSKSERARFEVPEFCAFAPTSDFANAGDPAFFVKWAEKLQLDASTLYNLFRALITDDNGTAVSFLPNLGKNRLGMLLMEIRDEFKSGASSIVAQGTTPSLHQFFADFLLQLLDVDSGPSPRLKIRLHRVNSFIVRASNDNNAKAISVDGRCSPLSIFYLAPFTADGLCFPTLEHYRWWKFFEHHSRFLQCVPGFWDHTDGRQLRAICEQWTNENLGLNSAALIERYRTDVEFDVLRNGALSKHSQNPHLLPMLFDGVSYGPIVAGETEGDSTFGIGMSAGKMRRIVERWRIRPETLTLWWTSLKVVKPANVGDNLFGLALMSARDEIFAIYCERAVTSIPMAPSVKNFHEITSEENYFVDDVDSQQLFFFSEEHPIFGLQLPVTIDGTDYASVIAYLLQECFSAVGMGYFSATKLGIDIGGSTREQLSTAREWAVQKSLETRYADWFKSKAADALKTVAATKAETDSEFRSLLLSTGEALLVGAIDEAGGNLECYDEDNAEMKALTIALTPGDFADFLRDLRPPSTQTLQFWTRCDAVSPSRLGSNLWAAALMIVRRAISHSNNVDLKMEVTEIQFCTLESVCGKTGNNGKSATAKMRPSVTAGKDRTETKLVSGLNSIFQESVGRDEDEMDFEPLMVLPPMSDVICTKKKDQDEDSESIVLEPMVDALRRCSSLFERVVSSTESNEELEKFGERLGEQIVSMFGDCSPDLAAFTDEDMYNLGRIAACQCKRSQ